jgi:ribosomal protein L37AE/L43A
MGTHPYTCPSVVRSNRRARGLCPECGRPLKLLTFEPGVVATWGCSSCDQRELFGPRTHFYQVARAQLGLGGRSCR